jgi:thioredoxin-like negative regulator of GroEL
MCARGDAQRACRIVSDLLAGGMEDLELLRRLLPVLVAAHDARTKQVFDALLKVTPQDAQLLQQKVLWALDNHDLPAAIEALQAHVAADPKNPLPLQSLANVQLAAGRNDDAMRTLEQLLALNPSNCAARQKVIGLLQQRDGGDPARVLEHKKLLAFYQRQTARWQAEGRKATSPTTQPPPPAPRK